MGEAQYDLVCSHGLIEHFENFSEIVRIHFKFVKSGGIVFITLPNYAVFPLKNLLSKFACDTLKTHNLRCMDIEILKKVVIASGGTEVEVGTFGGAILSPGTPNQCFLGTLYHQFCRLWNFSCFILGILTLGKSTLHFWDIRIYVRARKI